MEAQRLGSSPWACVASRGSLFKSTCVSMCPCVFLNLYLSLCVCRAGWGLCLHVCHVYVSASLCPMSLCPDMSAHTSPSLSRATGPWALHLPPSTIPGSQHPLLAQQTILPPGRTRGAWPRWSSPTCSSTTSRSGRWLTPPASTSRTCPSTSTRARP